MSKANRPESRRRFLQLGGVGAGLLVTATQAGAQSADSGLNIDLVISVSRDTQDGQSQDLGGIHHQNYPLSFLSQAACCVVPALAEGATGLTWQAPMAADSQASKPSDVKIEFNLVNNGNTIRLERFILQDDQNIVVDLGVELAIGDDPQILSEERVVDGVTYRFFGLLTKSKQDSLATGMTTTAGKLAQTVYKPRYSQYWWFDSGWVSVPFTNFQFRVSGPDWHPLGWCRTTSTTHINFDTRVKYATGTMRNGHFGGYWQGRGVCLVYWESVQQVCKKYCTPQFPTWNDCWNFSYQIADSNMRSLGWALPYAALAVIAGLLATAIYGLLGAVALI